MTCKLQNKCKCAMLISKFFQPEIEFYSEKRLLPRFDHVTKIEGNKK